MARDRATYLRQVAMEAALTQLQQTLREEASGIPPQEEDGVLARLQRLMVDLLFVLAARRARLFPEGDPAPPPPLEELEPVEEEPPPVEEEPPLVSVRS